MTRQDIIDRIKSGEKIKARISCYGKVYKRRLRIDSKIDGYLYCTTPKYVRYVLTMNQIISLHRA